MSINSYNQFLQKLQTKQIVFFGIGRVFYSYKFFLEEKNLEEKILAVVDNDEKKQGKKIEIHGKSFSIISFEKLIQIHSKDEFLILVTSVYFNEIQKQIKGCRQLCDIEVLDARYVLQSRESYLASYSNVFKEERAGVGKNGENMTISILMHNRAVLTVRLIESIREHIPYFKGEILIGDNGSEEEECSLVKQKLETINFKWKILKFDKNYPIPIGKNRLNMDCKADWVMQLDNDVYFTDNPIKKINEDISSLGCRIWGFPYYNTVAGKVVNYGSSLEFVKNENGEKVLVCRNDLPFHEDRNIWQPILCTYTSGGTSLMQKSFFKEIGGYDENIYINEDVELAYRINKAGYKIGNIGMKCLVHDHKRIDSEMGRRYEAVRFDEERIRQSKEYLKTKYGFIFA